MDDELNEEDLLNEEIDLDDSEWVALTGECYCRCFFPSQMMSIFTVGRC